MRVAPPSGGSPRRTDETGAQRAKIAADFWTLARERRTQIPERQYLQLAALYGLKVTPPREGRTPQRRGARWRLSRLGQQVTKARTTGRSSRSPKQQRPPPLVRVEHKLYVSSAFLLPVSNCLITAHCYKTRRDSAVRRARQFESFRAIKKVSRVPGTTNAGAGFAVLNFFSP